MGRTEKSRAHEQWLTQDAAIRQRLVQAPSEHELTAYATFRSRCLAAAGSTVPCDRARAERQVRAAYTLAGFGEPQLIVWMRSPLGGLVALLSAASGQSRSSALRGLSRRVRADHPSMIESMYGEAAAQLAGYEAPALRDSLDFVTKDLTWKLLEPAMYELMELTGNARGMSLRGQILEDQLGDLGARVSDVLGPVDRDLRRHIRRQGRRVLTGNRFHMPEAISPSSTGATVAHCASALFHVGGSPKVNTVAATLDTTGTWWATRTLAVIADRPIALATESDELRRRTGEPVATYADGYSIYTA